MTKPSADPQKTRDFAITVVKQLQGAGYQALWAGGCVRDELLGRQPTDYDVATDATPDQIRLVFGRRRTLSIGAAFGVIIVIGPKDAGQVDVATFRKDAEYSDGRRPDSVAFSSPEEDALRRDFTINGLFRDPIDDKIIDFVAGLDDLKQGVLRAIGDPYQRIAEDKLRMLRAIRFATTTGFELDLATLRAIQSQPENILVVSWERISIEMRRMLVHPNRASGLRLLRGSGLLFHILPLTQSLVAEQDNAPSRWDVALQVLDRLDSPKLPQVLTALLREVDSNNRPLTKQLASVCRQWKLPNDETDRTVWFVKHLDEILNATSVPWPTIQRILVAPGAADLLLLAESVSNVCNMGATSVEFCREKLALPAAILNPTPLINGNDLIKHGIPSGRAFSDLLRAARDAQLEGHIHNQQQALALIDDRWQAIQNGPE